MTYAERTSSDGNRIDNVFVSWTDDTGEHNDLGRQWRESHTTDEQPVLSLFNGHRYIGKPGQHRQQIASFAELHIPLEPVLLTADNLPLEAVATGQLSSNPKQLAELHWRMALPLFLLITAVLAVANAAVPPRQNPFVRLLPALGWIIAYYLALVANRWAISEAAIPLALGFGPAMDYLPSQPLLVCVACQIASPLSKLNGFHSGCFVNNELVAPSQNDRAQVNHPKRKHHVRQVVITLNIAPQSNHRANTDP